MKFGTGLTDSTQPTGLQPERRLVVGRARRARRDCSNAPAGCLGEAALPARPQAAFTLAEVLAALVFMAIVIPVAIEGLGIAGRAGEVAARKNEAALVAERILNENLITTNYNQAVQSGTLRQGIRDFRWTLKSEPWNEDASATDLRLLTVEVGFAAQGQDYQVRLSTLVDNSATLGQTNAMMTQ